MALSTALNIQRKFKRFLAFQGRAYLVWGNRYPPLYYLNCKLYSLFEKIICKRFTGIRGIVSLYLAHGRAIGDIFPGLSDFDLVIVFDPDKNSNFISEVRAEWNRIRQILPVRDVSLLSRNDFLSWQKCGAGVDPIDELQHWIILGGEELRKFDQLNLESANAERDRQRFAFSHYHSLLRCALKDEANTPLLLVTLRRQIYKNFCSTVIPLYRQLLQIPKQWKRLQEWGSITGEKEVLGKLFELRHSRFYKGEISRLSFSAAACAFQELDRVAKNPISFGPVVSRTSIPSIPIFNEQEIIARAKRFTSELFKEGEDRFKAACIVSNGSPRGYVLYIILQDNLKQDKITEIFRHVHELFRIFDDPWFNEHYPSGIPILCSEAMWKRELELWPFYSDYWQRHPCFLYGSLSQPSIIVNSLSNQHFMDRAIEGERSALSRYFNQVCLEHSQPALFDFLSLYLPRYILVRSKHLNPSTNTEAVEQFAQLDSPVKTLPKEILTQFGRHDIDALLREFPVSLIDKHRAILDQLLSSY